MSIKNEDNIYKDFFSPDISEAYKDKFIKVPCEYFEYLSFDDKLLLVLSSLFKHKTIYNTIIITLKDIIIENGYTPIKGKNRNIEHFKESLKNLMSLQLIEFYSVELQNIVNLQRKYENQSTKKNPGYLPEYVRLFDSITLNTNLALKFNEDKLKIMTDNNFTILDYNTTNIFKSICSKNSKVKMANLVNVYIILKKHIEANKHFSKKGWNLSISTLSDYLKLSRQTVCDIIRILESHNILIVEKNNGKNYYSLTPTKRNQLG